MQELRILLSVKTCKCSNKPVRENGVLELMVGPLVPRQDDRTVSIPRGQAGPDSSECCDSGSCGPLRASGLAVAPTPARASPDAGARDHDRVNAGRPALSKSRPFPRALLDEWPRTRRQ